MSVFAKRTRDDAPVNVSVSCREITRAIGFAQDDQPRGPGIGWRGAETLWARVRRTDAMRDRPPRARTEPGQGVRPSDADSADPTGRWDRTGLPSPRTPAVLRHCALINREGLAVNQTAGQVDDFAAPGPAGCHQTGTRPTCTPPDRRTGSCWCDAACPATARSGFTKAWRGSRSRSRRVGPCRGGQTFAGRTGVVHSDRDARFSEGSRALLNASCNVAATKCRPRRSAGADRPASPDPGRNRN